METLSTPCGGLRDYLANQNFLQRLTESPMDVLIFDELGLSYTALWQLTPCRQYLLLLDTPGRLPDASRLDSGRVVRGENWLSIPLTAATRVRLSPEHSPHRLEIGAHEARVVVEQVPRVSMAPMAAILQRLCGHRNDRAPLSLPGETRTSCLSHKHAQPSVTFPSSSVPRQPSAAPLTSTEPHALMDDLYTSLQTRLEEVRWMRHQMLQLGDDTPASVAKALNPHARRSPPLPTPNESAVRTGAASHQSSYQHTPIAAMMMGSTHLGPSSSPGSHLPTRERERLQQLERPQAPPYSAGHSFATLGATGPADDDASALRVYREIRGSSRSSLSEPGLPVSVSESDA